MWIFAGRICPKVYSLTLQLSCRLYLPHYELLFSKTWFIFIHGLYLCRKSGWNRKRKNWGLFGVLFLPPVINQTVERLTNDYYFLYVWGVCLTEVLTLKTPRKPASENLSSVYVICWIFLLTFQTYFCIQANSVNPDQTGPRGAVWSGATLFAKMTADDKADGSCCDWQFKG